MIRSTLEKILPTLRSICADDRVLIDTASLQAYGVDRTTRWQPCPCAVILPNSIDEVQAIVKCANTHELPIVPSGGRTGLSGGAVAKDGELVLAMDRMNKILDFNPIDQTIRCEAGAITQTIQEYAEQEGLYYPVNFASAGSSQIGGNVATNAGGINVIRYGMTRDWVVGLSVVTGAGKILELNRGLIKNNTGYDFRHLFIGSEGTLGIICEATVRLAPAPPGRSVQVLGVNDFETITEILSIYNSGLCLTAFEFFSDLALDKVLKHHKLPAPFTVRTPYYVLLEFEHKDDRDLAIALALFEECNDKQLVSDGVISQNQKQAEKLWRLREDISETLAPGKPYKNDISVNISLMPDFIRAVDELAQQSYPDFEIVWYGHIGDGNLHLNILKPDALSAQAFNQRCADVSIQVAELVAKFSGSISAEHGVGLLKKDLLHYSRSDSEIALMRQLKQVFDPNSILNPGKLI
ncbi:MAG: FAD-binding oxidoreductase [Porticoccaceae bacterium]|nr:FAD-binding oxidoreductase [Porticoccaceae bacterium]